jgi:hypothetical protein
VFRSQFDLSLQLCCNNQRTRASASPSCGHEKVEPSVYWLLVSASSDVALATRSQHLLYSSHGWQYALLVLGYCSTRCGGKFRTDDCLRLDRPLASRNQRFRCSSRARVNSRAILNEIHPSIDLAYARLSSEGRVSARFTNHVRQRPKEGPFFGTSTLPVSALQPQLRNGPLLDPILNITKMDA